MKKINANDWMMLKKVEHMGMISTVIVKLEHDGKGYSLSIEAQCNNIESSEFIDVYNAKNLSSFLGFTAMEVNARTVKEANEIIADLESMLVIDSLAKASCMKAYYARAKAIMRAAEESVKREKGAERIHEEANAEKAEAVEKLSGYCFQWDDSSIGRKAKGQRINIGAEALIGFRKVMETKAAEVLYNPLEMCYVVRLKSCDYGEMLYSSRSVAEKLAMIQPIECWGVEIECHVTWHGVSFATARYLDRAMTAYAVGKREAALQALAKVLDAITSEIERTCKPAQKPMKRYAVEYEDEDGRNSKVFIESESDETLGQSLMDYIDKRYGVDSQCDGSSIWSVDEDGIQVTWMNHISFRLEDEEEEDE